MLLNSQNTTGYINAGTLRCTFNKVGLAPKIYRFEIPTRNDMERLGRAFAEVANDLHSLSGEKKRPARIGLIANSGCGKSTFCHALTDAFDIAETLEKACKSREQHVWRTSKGSVIRHYDAMVGKVSNNAEGYRLPSYVNDNAREMFGLPLLDIVEHADKDEHSTKFDCLLKLRTSSGFHGHTETREVFIIAAPHMEQMQGFRSFLFSAGSFAPKVGT